MNNLDEEMETTLRAYRKARLKLFIHLGFVIACCIAASGLRGAFGLPPAFLSVVLIAAILLFSPEIFRFMRLRNELQRLERLRERAS
jgi:hypothetical protein